MCLCVHFLTCTHFRSFGFERLSEYKGKHMLDLCLVYGAEPLVLTQAPGGRDNAKMVSKALFQDLALPAPDGNYFLRPDRILGAFLLDPTHPPAEYARAEKEMSMQRENDCAVKDRLESVHLMSGSWGDDVREQRMSLRSSAASDTRSSAPSLVSDGVDPGESKEGDGLIELTSLQVKNQGQEDE
jgi:hypothetical protein